MNQETTIPTPSVSFKDFLFKNKRNRIILWIATAAIIIQFAIFKYLYPFASYIHGDSFSYLNAAYQNLNINTYMIGYSRFLRLFSVFSKSDLILTAFQYLLIQGSSLLLLNTIFYFYKPRKLTQYLLLCFMILNPLFLHLSNLISSDCLFVALSLIWFTLLLWIIQRPTTQIIVYHLLALFITFTVRYNALIYPFISATAFLIAPLALRNKIVGISVGFLICGLFVLYTSNEYKKLTGYWQYSPFSGWQLTNNAMYAYRYVNVIDRKEVPTKYQRLDKMIRDYFDTTRDVRKHPVEAKIASTFYMWSRGLPLYKYRNSLFKNDTTASELKMWASMGPFYKSYGLYIIKKYPWHFIRHFIWPNANRYYAPPVEFLAEYNSGKNYVNDQAKKWFNYENTKVTTRTNSNKVRILNFYPILSGIINVLMLFLLACYIFLKGWRTNPIAVRGILLGIIVWLLNAAFTISASSAALRFQSFPILLTTVFVALLADWLTKLAINTQPVNMLSHNPQISQPILIDNLVK